MSQGMNTHAPKRQSSVTIDIGPLLEDNWTGIPVFTRRLVQSLMRHGELDLEFCFNLTRIPKERVLAAIQAGTGTFLRADFERNAGRTYGLIDPDTPLLYPSVKESFGISKYEASTVHDLSALFMPENHEQANVDFHMTNLARELATNSVVFCVSEATRSALTLAFPSIGEKARVLYQYADWPEEFETIERNLPPLELGRYAAVVGTVEPRKNLTLLIEAMSLPVVRDSKIRFVVIGKKGWKVDHFLAQMKPDEQQHLVFSGFVSEFIKYRLLLHSEFLVFPSLYEGFGIPALEAMSLGKPVLASLTSSFPEVIGDAGVYFDPLSMSDFGTAFEQISGLGQQRLLAEKAKDRAAQFTWQRMAHPIVDWVQAS
jgi:glycosyltransferase involved in cell wall biosynthesis